MSEPLPTRDHALVEEASAACRRESGGGTTVADIERASDEAERRLVARHAGVRFVFLDPTPGDERARAEAHRPE
jgi:hypothetical protein